jgi:hypothetical protein
MDGIGSFAMMGLFGVIIAMLVNFFLKSPALSFVMSVAAVIVFTGLTAYDAQRLKRMALAVQGPQVGAYAVSGALSLYLNFINLFGHLRCSATAARLMPSSAPARPAIPRQQRRRRGAAGALAYLGHAPHGHCR